MRGRLRWRTAWVLGVVLLLPLSGGACTGDCDDDGRVTITDLVRGVAIALGEAALSSCEILDGNRDGAVAIAELIAAVDTALSSCAGGPADAAVLVVHAGGIDEVALGVGTRAAMVERTAATGQPCLLSRASGEYVVGAAAGLHVYAADGTFQRAIAIPDGGGVVRGCAVDESGRLFVTRERDGERGELGVLFPPDQATYCPLAGDLDAPGALALDGAEALHVATRTLPGRVLRFAAPFPAAAGDCGAVAPQRTTLIEYRDAVPTGGLAVDAQGHLFVAVVGAGEWLPGIREHAADGTFVRELFPPGSGGDPQALAFDATGALYYADRGPDGEGTAPAGRGALRRITFDEQGRPAAPELVEVGFASPDGLAVVPAREEWLTLGGSVRRTYFNPRERMINRSTAGDLILKWRYLTSGMISAQAAVTWVDLPGEGRTQIVIVSSWDGSVYALRAATGSLVWRYLRKPQPGTFYPFSGSPTVAWVDGAQRVFVPGGMTMYALDATTGAERWQFDAGTGCTDCTVREERNQIESSPAVANGLVFFGMDVNDDDPGKGGVYAVDARDGRLVWFFDLFSGATCRPLPGDDVRRYDGYHAAAALGLPEDFFATRPGCDHPRLGYGCGNVWSSPALDLRRGMLFIASSNCTTDFDPQTPEVEPPMPPYDEALFALTLDGDPVWVWRPREEDNADLAFGAVPNLFTAEIGGAPRDVVGIGNKDGTYYLLERDGTNALTGRIEPYWQTNVVPGGPIGGIIGSASVGDGQIVFTTGFGRSIAMPQKPAVHALDPRDGSVLWQESTVDASYAPCTGVPELALCGGTPRPDINVFARRDGEILTRLRTAPVPSGVAAAAAVVGGQVFAGGGTGAFNEGSDALREALRDTPLAAFCLAGRPGCTPRMCSDDNPCTYDYLDDAGTCISEPGAEGLDCMIDRVRGTCVAGNCVTGDQ